MLIHRAVASPSPVPRAIFTLALPALVLSAALGCGTTTPTPSPPEEPDREEGEGGAANTAWREADCPWPGSGPGRAAVSLTNDDSMPSHLRSAIPALDARGLRGTFFLNRVQNDASWKAALAAGHELGAHTPTHPCPASYGVPGTPLEEFTLEKMAEALDEDVAQLERLGAPLPYTFAYPCGVTWTGPNQESYAPLLAERFLAARGVGPGPEAVGGDLFETHGAFDLKTAAQLLDEVDRAVAAGGWSILGFHGIGGDWLVTDEAVHEEVLTNLAEREDVWVAPFGEVAACLHAASD